MKLRNAILALAAMCALGSHAESATQKASIEHIGDYMEVKFKLPLDTMSVSTNCAVIYTPVLVDNGIAGAEFPAAGVYGRTRYYQYLRGGMNPLSTAADMTFKASNRPDTLNYSQMVQYQDWMNGADLMLRRDVYGCCRKLLSSSLIPFGKYRDLDKWFPTLVFMAPAADHNAKVRELAGEAFIDFPVDKTVIYPDYRRNTVELAKIQASIDSVRNDADITIDSLFLKGYASPESPYAHNTDLARGRTAALKDYINNLYHFPKGVIYTAFEPEDWAGLRRFVEGSNLEHKTEILEIIDSNLAPDPKEARIKSRYPQEYQFLLRQVYPALRHTDYRIVYTIRSYNDVEEIARVFERAPQNLSLNEFNLLAETYEPGSDDFERVYEMAALIHPTDATANINAANAAMRRGNLDTAEKYLTRAGNSPEAVYARAALAIRRHDWATAKSLLQQAADAGLQQAADTLAELPDYMD